MNVTNGHEKLPDVVNINDVTLGDIDANYVLNELENLKVEISILRNDMSAFLKALATIPNNTSQQEYYNVIILRLQAMQSLIKDYCVHYNKFLPVINFSQVQLGRDVEVLSQQHESGSGVSTKGYDGNQSLKSEPNK